MKFVILTLAGIAGCFLGSAIGSAGTYFSLWWLTSVLAGPDEWERGMKDWGLFIAHGGWAAGMLIGAAAATGWCERRLSAKKGQS